MATQGALSEFGGTYEYCRKCKGSGVALDDYGRKQRGECFRCGGTGLEPVNGGGVKNVPVFGQPRDDCKKCKGMGTVIEHREHVDCDRCGGTGLEPERKVEKSNDKA